MKASVAAECISAISTATTTVGALKDIDLSATMKSSVGAECASALDTAFTDATGLTGNGLKDRFRIIGWLIRNKMAVTDLNGNTVLYKDDNAAQAFSVPAALTDDSTTTTRLRIE
jgi:hypothetical protein